MTINEKSREINLRRKAARQGKALQKSRMRDTDAWITGTYGIYDVETRALLADVAGSGYGLSLDDVEAYLKGERA